MPKDQTKGSGPKFANTPIQKSGDIAGTQSPAGTQQPIFGDNVILSESASHQPLAPVAPVSALGTAGLLQEGDDKEEIPNMSLETENTFKVMQDVVADNPVVQPDVKDGEDQQNKALSRKKSSRNFGEKILIKVDGENIFIKVESSFLKCAE